MVMFEKYVCLENKELSGICDFRVSFKAGKFDSNSSKMWSNLLRIILNLSRYYLKQ